MAAPSKPLVQIQYGSMFPSSLEKAIKDTPNVVEKLKQFLATKEADPMANFGTNDKGFVSAGSYKQEMPKARKAHLTNDLSIIYMLSGKNPTNIKLFGVFSHADLGTGSPANIKIQKNMAKKLAVSESKKLDKPTPTVDDLVKKNSTTKMEVLKQLDAGIKVELEHTTSREVAKEIALDHLGEKLYYYEILKANNL